MSQDAFAPQGRTAAALAVGQAVEALAGGHGGVSLIVGAPGIGKSRLLDDARRHAEQRGIACLRAHGDPAERRMPFVVLRALMEPGVQRLDAERRERLLSGVVAVDSHLFADADLTPNFPHAPAEQYVPGPRVLHGLDVMLRILSERPLLLCIDDGQWVDDATLRWVAYIANRIDRFPALILLASRPVVGRDDTLAALVANPALPIARLAPFADADGVSGGIPLVAEAVAAGDGAAVERFVAAVLSDLGREATALAQALALLGDVEPHLAPHVAGLSARAAAAAADRLRAACVVDARGLFTSSAIKGAIIEAISADERDALRERSAAALVAHGAPATLVADQLVEIEHALDAAQVDALRGAADAAAKDGDLAACATYLRRVEREALSVGVRGEVRLQLARVLAASDGDGADVAFAQALEVAADATSRAAVQLAQAEMLIEQARGEPLELIDHVLGGEAQGDPSIDPTLVTRAEALRGMLVTRPGLAAAVAGRVVARSSTIQPPSASERELLCVAAYAALATGDGATATRQAARALDEPGPLRAVSAAALELGIVAAAQTGQVSLAARAADAAVNAARHSADRLSEASALAQRVVADIAAGRLAAAVEHATVALERLPPNAVVARGATTARAAIALVAQGRFDDAERLLADHPRADDTAVTSLLHLDLALALLRLEQGQPQEAIGCLDALVVLETPAFLVSVAATLSRALLAVGDAPGAERVASENLERVRAARCGPTALSVALRAYGVACGLSERLSSLSEAVALARRGEGPLELARALLELGMALRRAGRRADARSSLTEAIAMAQRLGAAPLAELAAAELAATGSRVRRDGLLARQRLTPSEERIARLAADGLSNPQIASSQYLTRKTVEMHLTNVYGKLGITSRSQLSDALAQASAELAR